MIHYRYLLRLRASRVYAKGLFAVHKVFQYHHLRYHSVFGLNVQASAEETKECISQQLDYKLLFNSVFAAKSACCQLILLKGRSGPQLA